MIESYKDSYLADLESRIQSLEEQIVKKPDYVCSATNNKNKLNLTIPNSTSSNLNLYCWLFIATYKDWATNTSHGALRSISLWNWSSDWNI